ncbi:hypothetical protein [Paracidovorax anthurii]|uniref:hypothetical protein n=1 Tax=Paracidovorax anthurii TaxID=78229 RepID=UPI00336A69CD
MFHTDSTLRPRILMILRSQPYRLSMALAVQKTRRTERLKAKNGITASAASVLTAAWMGFKATA